VNNELAVQLHQLVWRMDRKADQVLRRDYDLPLSWGRLLITLAKTGPLTQHDLALRLSHSDPAISRQLERMSESGLLTVTVHPSHRRKRLVDLTSLGREMVIQASSTLDELLQSDMIRAGIDIQRFADCVAALAEELAAPSE